MHMFSGVAYPHNQTIGDEEQKLMQFTDWAPVPGTYNKRQAAVWIEDRDQYIANLQNASDFTRTRSDMRSEYRSLSKALRKKETAADQNKRRAVRKLHQLIKTNYEKYLVSPGLPSILATLFSSFV